MDVPQVHELGSAFICYLYLIMSEVKPKKLIKFVIVSIVRLLLNVNCAVIFVPPPRRSVITVV